MIKYIEAETFWKKILDTLYIKTYPTIIIKHYTLSIYFSEVTAWIGKAFIEAKRVETYLEHKNDILVKIVTILTSLLRLNWSGLVCFLYKSEAVLRI